MPLIIEDGTGVAGADSFATLAELDAIRLNLFTSTGGVDADREAALRRAFLYLQSLGWRNSYSFPKFDDTILVEVSRAQCILAHQEILSPNSLQPSTVPGQQKILNQVGSIRWKVDAQPGVNAQGAVVKMAMNLLKDYILDHGATKFLQRS